MATAAKDHYAERTSVAPLRANPWRVALRTVFGFVALVGLYTGVGFLVYGRVLAIAGLVYLLVFGPWIILPARFLYLRLWGRLTRLNLRSPEHGELAQFYFESILRKPGPSPRFYLWKSQDLAIFWFQALSPFSQRQIVVLPQAWFEESEKHRALDFVALWDQIDQLSPASSPVLGRLRSVQFLMWVSAMLPVELLFRIFQKGVDLSGFSGLQCVPRSWPFAKWLLR